MILAALFCLASISSTSRQAPTTDVELVPERQPGIISVEALVRLSPLGAHDQAIARVMVRALLSDTDDFTRGQLRAMTAATGDVARSELLPDCIRFHFGLAAPDRDELVPILASVLHGSKLAEEDVLAARDDLKFTVPQYWSSALDPSTPNYASVRPEEVVDFYHRWFRPENFVISIAGPPALAVVRDRWASEVAGWEFPRLRPYIADHDPLSIASTRPGRLATLVDRGVPFAADSPSLPAKLLAIFGLGGGKRSAVWKVFREGEGWSYRQEVLVRNAPQGIQPVIALATERDPKNPSRIGQLWDLLSAQVSGWTEADRTRAIGAADALLSRGAGLNPFYFLSTATIPPDSLYMRTYWRLKTGKDFDAPSLLQAIRVVPLETMKREANELFEKASGELIEGRD